jgi:hypothetical protein
VVEIDARYCDVSVNRWENYSGKKARLESGGQSWEEIAEQRREAIEGRVA